LIFHLLECRQHGLAVIGDALQVTGARGIDLCDDPGRNSAAGASTLTILDRTFDSPATHAEIRSTDPR